MALEPHTSVSAPVAARPVLSRYLWDHGFHNVLGTKEKLGGEECDVAQGTPYTCDVNNGVIVVCDQSGTPWIARAITVSQLIAGLVAAYGLKQGAYVPHSNDGGAYVNGLAERS